MIQRFPRYIRIFSFFTLSRKQNSSSHPQAYPPPPPRKVNQLTRDSTHPLAWQLTDPCPIDQLCHNRMKAGLHLTAFCSDLISSSSGTSSFPSPQRNVNEVRSSPPSYSSDALRYLASLDNDFTIEDNP